MGRGEGEVEATRFCRHEHAVGALCPQCVTLIRVALGMLDGPATIDSVTALADDYAMRVVADLPHTASESELLRGLAGAFLSFLADAVLTANSMRA
jgi:hypothetical protein